MKRHIRPAPHRRRLVVAALGVAQAAVHRPDGIRQAEPVMNVELRRVPHFNVAHPFREVVFRQLKRNPFDALGIPHHGAGVGESFEVFGQVGILVLEHQPPQTGLRMRRQFDAVLLGQLEQRRQAH